jgi:acetylglutamate kinase
MNQLTIVKVGGRIIEDEETRKAFLKSFSLIAGFKILVHGGGVAATQWAERMGIPSRIADGRRITDADMLTVVTMVYAGLINKNLVAQMQALSLDAVGLSGADMNLVLASRRKVAEVDYGFVGDIREVNVPALRELLDQNYVPVIAPITHDGAGQLLNTNADTIAGEIAVALAYDYNVRLIYCTDTKGVLQNAENAESTIGSMTREEFLEYKAAGVIGGGMIPKLESAFCAIAAGVKEIILIRASDMHTGSGTLIH